MCVRVLPELMYVFHVHSFYLWRPEDGIDCSITGLRWLYQHCGAGKPTRLLCNRGRSSYHQVILLAPHALNIICIYVAQPPDQPFCTSVLTCTFSFGKISSTSQHSQVFALHVSMTVALGSRPRILSTPSSLQGSPSFSARAK